MNQKQMEISFQECRRTPQPVRIRQRRRARAQWWFDRMRHVVNQALDWNPAPPARPQQIYLSLARAK